MKYQKAPQEEEFGIEDWWILLWKTSLSITKYIYIFFFDGVGWSGRGVGGSNFSYICTRVKHNTSPCHSLSNHSRCCENPVQAEALVEFCATSHWDLPTESSPSGLSSSTCLIKVFIIFLIALEKLHPLWISEGRGLDLSEGCQETMLQRNTES